MKKLLFIVCSLSFFILFQCSSDEAPLIEAEPNEDFNTYVQSMSYIQQAEEIETPVVVEVISGDQTADNYTCNVTRYKAAPGFNELALMDPTTDVIFPGAMIKGESVPTGEYIPIIADRAPMNISVSLQNIAGSPYRTIENPSLSSVRAAVHDIFKDDVTGATPAQISFTIEEVHSEEQFNLAVGVNFKTPLTKMSGSFDFNDETKRSRIVVKFLQIYYTIDVDPNASPEDFFNTMPNTDLFGSVSPLYISTVTYGRMALFTFESEYSSSEMKGAIEATFKSKLGNETGVEISARDKTKIESSKMNAVIFGGSGSSGVNAIHGIEGLIEYIDQGGDYSKDSPGAPLSYKMRYLKDNSIAKVVLTSEYNVRSCDVNLNYKISVKEINAGTLYSDDDDKITELYGRVIYKINDQNPEYILWQVSSNEAIAVAKNENLDFDYKINLVNFKEKLDYIVIYGELNDKDPEVSEHYSCDPYRIELEDWEDEYYIPFPQGASVKISFTPDN